MPRLLMVATYPLTMQTFLLPYAKHFRSRGWQVDALASGDMNAIAGHFDRALNVDWSKSLLSPQKWFTAPRTLRELVASGRYDLIHVHTPVAGFATRFALRAMRRTSKLKIIYTAHGFHFYAEGGTLRNIPFIAAEKLAGRWTDYLVVMNREDEAAARHHRLVPEPSLRVMPGIGIDLESFTKEILDPEVRAAKSEIGLAPNEPYLLCVAEFRPVKRHDNLLKAFARVASGDSARLQLLLAGNGPLLEDTRRLARTLGISDRVHFLGFRTDIPVLLRGARALVLASQREGLPRCVLEAMVAGVPVIGTEAKGTSDLLSDGRGLLVPLNDPAALSEAIADTLNDSRRAEERARRAAREVSRYDLRKLLALHETLYSEALEGTPAAESAMAV